MEAFVCSRCGAVSTNPNDVSERYCWRCHAFVEDPAAEGGEAMEAVEMGFLLALVRRWRVEADRHRQAAAELRKLAEEEVEVELHFEAALVYRRCADELEAEGLRR